MKFVACYQGPADGGGSPGQGTDPIPFEQTLLTSYPGLSLI